MAGRAPHDDEDDKETLDPAAERVRRKLVRFMGVNLAILFAAVMAVVAALVYKSVTPVPETPTAVVGQAGKAGQLLLPAGSVVLSHAIDGGTASFHLRLSGGSEALLLFDLNDGAQIGHFALDRE